ncbi:MAG: SBBP repeat-containing protein [Candidatus Cloacimonadia bacterium]
MRRYGALFLVTMFVVLTLSAQEYDWHWANSTGASFEDEGKSIAVDAEGNSYVIGYFWYTATFGSTTLTSSGSADIFIAKSDKDGNWLWAKQAGGSSADWGESIAVDSEGNCYVTGSFLDTASFGSTMLTSNGGRDIFIAKLDQNGNWLWAEKAGGSELDVGYGIAVDSEGNSYVTGYFCETATFGSTTLTSSGSEDIFIAKLDQNGNWLWTEKAGGSELDVGYGIAVDSEGNSYVTGCFWEAATFGNTTLTSSLTADIFVAKMDKNGNWLWAEKAGGRLIDEARSIAIDSAGNSYVTGYFYDTATFGSTTLTNSDYENAFIAKMDANGNWLWAKSTGGLSNDQGYGIAIDSTGNSYVIGCFEGRVTFDNIRLTSNGERDIFIAKLDQNGNWLWAKGAGGSSYDNGHSIAVDSAGNGYLTGGFFGTATFGSITLTSRGSYDIFIAKLEKDDSVGVEDYVLASPGTELNRNYPNPFNPETKLNFSLAEPGIVKIDVYNLQGQLLKTLTNAYYPSGHYTVVWDGSDSSNKQVGSGIYFYRMKAKDYIETRRMSLIK